MTKVLYNFTVSGWKDATPQHSCSEIHRNEMYAEITNGLKVCVYLDLNFYAKSVQTETVVGRTMMKTRQLLLVMHGHFKSPRKQHRALTIAKDYFNEVKIRSWLKKKQKIIFSRWNTNKTQNQPKNIHPKTTRRNCPNKTPKLRISNTISFG